MLSVGSPSKRADGITGSEILPVSDDEGHFDPRYELSSIVQGLKAHLDWLEESGATGVPRDASLASRLKESPLPQFQGHNLAPQTRSHEAPLEHVGGRSNDESRRTHPHPGASTPANESAPTTSQFVVPRFDQDPPKRRATAMPKAPLVAARSSNKQHLISLGATLDEVRTRASTCLQCELHTHRKQSVFSRGNGSSGRCFVGDAPDAEDDARGEPFSGPAGELLDKMIVAMGMSRDDVYVCNIVKCRPEHDRHPRPPEIQTCSQYLERQLDLLQPQVIVALGGIAVSGLLGLTEGISRLRGSFRLYQGRIAVMPTFHPAYLLRNPGAKRQVWTDLQKVLQQMGRSLPSKA